MIPSNKNIKVSVIVPVYNVERYLQKSILSIVNQTLRDIEIILIDDGSTDNSLSIMKELASKDTRIKIFSQPNHGQSIARNIGLVNSIGEYIYFFDSDDILEEKTLEECYNKCHSQELDLLFFDADVFSDDNISMKFTSYKRTYRFEDKIYKGTDILNEQLNTNLFSASVCLTFIKKEYLKKNNLYFYPSIIHEDELFVFILFLKAKKIGLINKIYFHRRLRPNSTMTTSFGYKNIVGYLTVCRELKHILDLSETTKEEKILLKRRLRELISVLIFKSESIIPEKRVNLIQAIKEEFQTYLNAKLILKLYFPYLFKFLVSIRK